jgi:hypothetical protein
MFLVFIAPSVDSTKWMLLYVCTGKFELILYDQREMIPHVLQSRFQGSLGHICKAVLVL